MSTEVVVQDTNTVQLGSLRTNGPADVVAQATAIANTLASVIESRGFFTNIRGKRYVRVEGWTTMLNLLGINPAESKVEAHEDGSYTATVELIRTSDGVVIGRGSAIVGMDESTWAGRPAYARRSMAITRATGKAARLAFSWIVSMSGFEVTPAEEMPMVIENKSKGNEPDTSLRDHYNALWQKCLAEGIPGKELTKITPKSSDDEIKSAGVGNRAVLEAAIGPA